MTPSINIALRDSVGIHIENPRQIEHSSDELFTADGRKFRHHRSLASSERKKQSIFDIKDLDISLIREEHKGELIEILEQYQSMWDGNLREINLAKHRIELLPENRPIRQHSYQTRMSAKEFEAIEIQRRLLDGMIRPSKSEWASPIVLAPKNDGNLRFCVEHRRLNAVMKKDSCSIPKIDDCIDILRKRRFSPHSM